MLLNDTDGTWAKRDWMNGGHAIEQINEPSNVMLPTAKAVTKFSGGFEFILGLLSRVKPPFQG